MEFNVKTYCKESRIPCFYVCNDGIEEVHGKMEAH